MRRLGQPRQFGRCCARGRGTPVCNRSAHASSVSAQTSWGRFVMDQNAIWRRVRKAFSGWAVTGPRLPPRKSVWKKFPAARIFLFKYQLKPRDQAVASEVDLAGSAKRGNAPSSTRSEEYLPSTSNAPHEFWWGSNGCKGATPRSVASSPVRTQPADTCQARFLIVLENPVSLLLNCCDEMTYSPIVLDGP